MKKKYEKPMIEVIEIETEDVISCSCGRPGNHHGHHKPNGKPEKKDNDLPRTNFYDRY